jgi:hypothetical protein
LEQHPNTLEAILSKALQAFRVRNDPLSNLQDYRRVFVCL